MTKEQVREEIKNLAIEHLDLNAADFEGRQKVSDLGVDSLDAVEFLMMIEKKYDIKIPDNEVEIKYIGDFAEVAMRYISTE